MSVKSFNEVDEVLFSFTYAHAKQASNCNEKLAQLMNPSIIPEIGKAFDQLNYSGIQLELKNLEIDLGKIREEEITFRLAERIKEALVHALNAELSNQTGVHPIYSRNSNLGEEDFAFLAIRSFFIYGYFPSWVDQSWDIYSILNRMLHDFPESFGRLIKEMSHKNNATRERIAYLKSDFFDRIIAVLVPTDAAWIIDFRENYLHIHQEESRLPGSSANLEKAINLFILNFIVQDSGPKFNRLSFTDHFLKKIAAHYNIDFRLFLKEINQIVTDLSVKNQLQKDFKDAIQWVGERNIKSDFSDAQEFEPTAQDFIAWLNLDRENPELQLWMKSMELSGIIFYGLADKFPDFWYKLTTKGLTRLIEILAGVEAKKWVNLTKAFSEITSQETLGKGLAQHEELIKAVLDLAGKEALGKGVSLFDLEDWFFLHAHLFFGRFTSDTFSIDSFVEIIDLGIKHGVSNAPLLWIRAKNASKLTAGFQRNPLLGDGEYSKSEDYSLPASNKRQPEHSGLYEVSMVLAYLNSNLQDGLSDKLTEARLNGILSNLVKNQNPVLLDWIKKSDQGSNPKFKARLVKLISDLNRNDFLDYVSKLNGYDTLRLLGTDFESEVSHRSESETGHQLFPLKDSVNTLLDPTRSRTPIDESFSATGSFQELALLEYLKSGSLGMSYRYLGQRDLIEILEGLMKSQNPVLLGWIKQSRTTNNQVFISRIWGLIKQSNRSCFLDYVKHFASSQTLKLIESLTVLSSWSELDLKSLTQIDELIWVSFLHEISPVKSKNTLAQLSPALQAADTFLAILNQRASGTSTDLNKVSALQHYINSTKNFILLSTLNKGFKKALDSNLSYFLTSKSLGGTQSGLLSIASNDFRKLRMNMSSLKLDFQNQSAVSADLLNLIALPQFKAAYKELLKLEESRSEAFSILKRDFNTLLNASFYTNSEKFRETELKAAVKRMYCFLLLDPDTLQRFISKIKSRLLLILPYIKENLSLSEWGRFSVWMKRKFRSEFDKFENAWKAGNISFWLTLDSKSLSSKLYLQDIPNFDTILDQSFKELSHTKTTSEEITRLFFSSSYYSKDVITLLNIPNTVFYQKHLVFKWKRMVLLSLYQFKAEKDFSTNTRNPHFWKIFLTLLKSRSSSFNSRSMNWDFLISKVNLNSETKSILQDFINRHSSVKKSLWKDPRLEESIPGSILFLKQEGYLPWWSPIKSKFSLIQNLLEKIESVDTEDASPLISILISGNLNRLISGISATDLITIMERLSKSRNAKYYTGLIALISTRITTLKPQRPVEIHVKESSDFSSKWAAANFKKLTLPALENRIKRTINASQELKLIRVWFSVDPRIQKQMEDLIVWSPLMYFGNLNPGYWKLWLLSFGFDFYIKSGNSYSRGFLSQFITHLVRSHSHVNWKGVFQQLVSRKDFISDRNKFYRVEVLTLFPMEEKASFEEPKTGDQVRVKNAGLILCWPFLSVLFSRLKLSVGNKIPEENQSKAVYLLQYLVYGHVDFPEYELVLNKILVGMKSSQHLQEVELSTEEKEMTESLLKGMGNNWDKMKNASIDAIRETFLQREGLLGFAPESFVLNVPKTGVDILLDSIAWNIAIIRLPWMEKSLEVKWR